MTPMPTQYVGPQIVTLTIPQVRMHRPTQHTGNKQATDRTGGNKNYLQAEQNSNPQEVSNMLQVKSTPSIQCPVQPGQRQEPAVTQSNTAPTMDDTKAPEICRTLSLEKKTTGTSSEAVPSHAHLPTIHIQHTIDDQHEGRLE